MRLLSTPDSEYTCGFQVLRLLSIRFLNTAVSEHAVLSTALFEDEFIGGRRENHLKLKKKRKIVSYFHR